MSNRPRFTNKDKNHNIVTDFMRYGCGGFQTAPKKNEAGEKLAGDTLAHTANYHGYKFVAYDCANIGGVFSDWLIECVDTGAARWVEIKTEEAYKAKDHSLKPGEKWLMENSGMFCIIVTDEDVAGLFERMTNE